LTPQNAASRFITRSSASFSVSSKNTAPPQVRLMTWKQFDSMCPNPRTRRRPLPGRFIPGYTPVNAFTPTNGSFPFVTSASLMVTS